MIESNNLTVYNLTCDKCGKTKSVICKNPNEINNVPFTINLETNECLCNACAKQLEKYNKKSIYDDITLNDTYPLSTLIEHINDARKKDMIKLRLTGLSLDKIGKKYGVTRERVRQLTSDILDQMSAIEDTFDALYWFKTYSFLSKENLISIFDISEQTYYYYKCKYDRNSNTTKDDLFNDFNLTEELKESFDKVLIYSKEAKDAQWHEKALKTYASLFENNPHGQLTVLDITREYSTTQKKWLYKAICQCSCGNYTTVVINMLPRTKSCGCAQKNIRDWITSPSKRPTKPCRNIETGEIFVSITEAAKSVNMTLGSIINSCKYPNYTAGGYHWEYVDKKYGRNYFECENTKKVRCIETEEIFNSVNEARRKYPSMANTLYGHIKSTNGYHFEFVEE